MSAGAVEEKEKQRSSSSWPSKNERLANERRRKDAGLNLLGAWSLGQIAVWSPFQVKTVQGFVSGNFEKFSPFLVCLCYGVIREDDSPFSNNLWRTSNNRGYFRI